jgi:outer membrane biosynthesis protein TonB
MQAQRTLAIVALFAILLGASACKQKKKPPVPPPAAVAPTITEPPPTNPGTPPPVSAEPSRPLPTPGESAATAELEKPTPRPKNHVARKTVPPPPAPEPPKKPTGASAGQNSSGQLTASNLRGDSIQQRLDTTQLINAAENTLRGITRPLNGDEQALVQHIRSFINQSQTATKEGDLDRAYNLAFKAHQLSDELAKK